MEILVTIDFYKNRSGNKFSFNSLVLESNLQLKEKKKQAKKEGKEKIEEEEDQEKVMNSGTRNLVFE